MYVELDAMNVGIDLAHNVRELVQQVTWKEDMVNGVDHSVAGRNIYLYKVSMVNLHAWKQEIEIKGKA